MKITKLQIKIIEGRYGFRVEISDDNRTEYYPPAQNAGSFVETMTYPIITNEQAKSLMPKETFIHHSVSRFLGYIENE